MGRSFLNTALQSTSEQYKILVYLSSSAAKQHNSRSPIHFLPFNAAWILSRKAGLFYYNYVIQKGFVDCEWQPLALQWERWRCSIWNAGREICRLECYLETSLNFHHYLMADQWQCAVSQTHLDSSLLLGRTLHTSLEMQLDPETEHLSQEWHIF